MLAVVGLPQSLCRESGRPVDRPLGLLADFHNFAVLLNQTLRETEGPEVPIGVKHPLTDAKGCAVEAASYDCLVDIAAGFDRSTVVPRVAVRGCPDWSVDILRGGSGGYSDFDVGLSQYRWGRSKQYLFHFRVETGA